MATVEFQRGEFGQLFAHSRRQGHAGPNIASEISELYETLQRAGARRGAEEAMQAANDLMEGHGVEALRVEGVHVDNYHHDIVATYVNLGDTYALTLIHDSENNSFHLMSWGDWLEAYEQEHQNTGPCARCTEEFPVDDLNEDSLCTACAVQQEEEEEGEVPRRLLPSCG